MTLLDYIEELMDQYFAKKREVVGYQTRELGKRLEKVKSN